MKGYAYLDILNRYKKDLESLSEFVSYNREHLTAEQMVLPYRVILKMIQNDYISTVIYGKHLPQSGTVELKDGNGHVNTTQTLFQSADSAFIHVDLTKPAYRSKYTVGVHEHQGSISFKVINTNSLPKLAVRTKISTLASDRTVRTAFLTYIDIVLDWINKRMRLYTKTHQRFFNRLHHVQREESAVASGRYSFRRIFGKSPKNYLSNN